MHTQPFIHRDFPLQTHNTFGIAANARAYVRIHTIDDLIAVKENSELMTLPRLVLGGGSNLLFSGDFDGLVLQLALAGRSIQPLDDNSALVEAQAGERWHDFVLWTLQQGWCGLENLALIPGSVGAAPIQNIGAYGVEIKDRMHSLQALDLHTGEVVTLNVDDCQFGYRDSLFKQQGKGRYIILSVTFKLHRQRELKLDYGDVAAELQQQGINQPTSLDVAHAVMAIRQRKLPDPAHIGNAGSFFKNPLVSAERLAQIRADYPNAPAYPQADGQSKLAAGWLIDLCGWKGQSRGHAGVYEKQALVLVNRGGATGAEILALAREIQASVLQRFGVELEMEPVVV
jgi:UDP-N-acetylmuramate dehydrogenase